MPQQTIKIEAAYHGDEPPIETIHRLEAVDSDAAIARIMGNLSEFIPIYLDPENDDSVLLRAKVTYAAPSRFD